MSIARYTVGSRRTGVPVWDKRSGAPCVLRTFGHPAAVGKGSGGVPLPTATGRKELSLSDGAEEFALNLTDLLLPRPITCICFRFIAGDAAGAYMMETATTAVQESRHDLVLEVSANQANDFKVYLPFCDDYLKGTVNWGDGTVEKVEGWNMYGVSHEYETEQCHHV